MTTTNYNIRLEQELKDNAFSVFESYGLTPSHTIKLFLTQMVQTNTVPLSFEYQARANINTLEETVKSLAHLTLYKHLNKRAKRLRPFSSR